jgi:hypothetical protein
MSHIAFAANQVSLILTGVRALVRLVIGALLILFAAWLALPLRDAWIVNALAVLVGWQGLVAVGAGLQMLADRRSRNPVDTVSNHPAKQSRSHSAQAWQRSRREL